MRCSAILKCRTSGIDRSTCAGIIWQLSQALQSQSIKDSINGQFDLQVILDNGYFYTSI